MQAMHGKIRLLGKLTINGFKIVDLKKAVMDSAVTCSSPQFCSHPLWLQELSKMHGEEVSLCRLVVCRAYVDQINEGHKEFGTETGFLISFNGISKLEKPCADSTQCLSQLAKHMPTYSCFSTYSIESAPQDASVSMSNVPPRIKFKRLDKTARHIMQILNKEAVEEVKAKREIPDIKPGCIVQLKVEVPENKRRVSIVKGIVIARRNAGISTTFRLRRLVAGVGVESLYQLYSPNIKEIKVLDKKKVRRAKLYYLRDKMNALKK